ncbi:hypothetical protein GC173_04890 [bacterium]|nr:hypothetical protein [bacterium]
MLSIHRLVLLVALPALTQFAAAQLTPDLSAPLLEGAEPSLSADRNNDLILDAADVMTPVGNETTTAAEFQVMMNDLVDFLAALPGDLSDEERATRAVEWLLASGGMEGAAVGNAGTVWAHTPDGLVLVYDFGASLARGAAGGAFTSTKRKAPSFGGKVTSQEIGPKAPGFTYPLHEIPTSRKAMLFQGIGNGFESYTAALPAIRQALEVSGYEVDAGSIAEVARLAAAKDLGVFYFHGQGVSAELGQVVEGQWSLNNIAYDALVTADDVTEANIPAHEAALRAGRLVVANTVQAYDENGDPIRVWTYAVTADFLRDNVTIGPNGLVVLSVANSMNTTLPDLFHELGAGAVVGWDGADMIDSDAALGMYYLFLRLSGFDTLPDDGPVPVRPFDLRAVIDSALNEREITWADGTNGMVGTQRTGADIQMSVDPEIRSLLLRPAIRGLYADASQGTLTITGDFGYTELDDEFIRIGGSPVGFVERNPFIIVCTLPETGAGSFGSVVFGAGDRLSNAQVLSRYSGSYTWQNRDKETSTWATGSGTFAFRTATLPHRLTPESIPATVLEWSQIIGTFNQNDPDVQELILSYSDIQFGAHLDHLDPESTFSYQYGGAVPGGCPDVFVTGSGTLSHFYLDPFGGTLPPAEGFAGYVTYFGEEVGSNERALSLTAIGASGTLNSDCPNTDPEPYPEYDGAPLRLYMERGADFTLTPIIREVDDNPDDPTGDAATVTPLTFDVEGMPLAEGTAGR